MPNVTIEITLCFIDRYIVVYYQKETFLIIHNFYYKIWIYHLSVKSGYMCLLHNCVSRMCLVYLKYFLWKVGNINLRTTRWKYIYLVIYDHWKLDWNWPWKTEGGRPKEKSNKYVILEIELKVGFEIGRKWQKAVQNSERKGQVLL